MQGLNFRIIERNYRSFGGEIDIIAMDKDVIVFVEVRARKDAKSGSAAESIDIFKQRRICKTALSYIRRKRLSPDMPFRFDTITFDNGICRHIASAFDFV